MLKEIAKKELVKEYVSIEIAAVKSGLSVLQLYSLICNNMLEYKISAKNTYINLISLNGWIIANDKVSKELKKNYSNRNVAFSFAEYLKYDSFKYTRGLR